MKQKIFFRADGNAQIGLGHVFRSLALAEMLQEEFECHFMIRTPLPTLKKQILEVCKEIVELSENENDIHEAKLLAETYLDGPEIVVLDGYHFITEYQQIIKNKGCRLVCIDDIYNYHFFADIIINHAGGVKRENYSFEPYTQFCLGLDFSLLRKPFRNNAINKNKENRKEGIFICLGGADPKNNTLSVLKKCEKEPSVQNCFIVLGGAYKHRKELDPFLHKTRLNVQILSNLNAQQMAAMMRKCDKAILTPSTVSYEYLSSGGEIYLKTIADNQKDIHQYFIKEKLAFDWNEFPNTNAKTLGIMLAKQNKMMDGRQQKRFVRIFQSLGMNARKAKKEDCRLYHVWSNDPLTRQQSYNSEPIPYESHEKWFFNKLKDENSYLYVITNNQQPIGQIRFDIKKEEAIISYSLDKNERGKGWGSAIIRRGMRELKKTEHKNKPIVGFVKFNNIGSIKAFRTILEFRETVAENMDDSYKYIAE